MAVFEVIAICSALLFLYYIFTLFAYRLWELPGPALAKVSDLWRLVEAWKGHQELALQDLHRKHGKLVQIGPNVVSITDPDAIETIYGLRTDLSKVSPCSTTRNERNLWG